MKVKFQKSKGNDCVHRALHNLTKIPQKQLAKDLPLSKEGVKYDVWKKYATTKLGLKVKEMKKPLPVTLDAIQQMSVGHKSGIMVRASSNAGNHTFFVKGGKITDDVTKANKNSVMNLHAIVSKD